MMFGDHVILGIKPVLNASYLYPKNCTIFWPQIFIFTSPQVMLLTREHI